MQPIFQQMENSRCDQCEQDRGRAFRLMTLDENIPRNQSRQNPSVGGELWWKTLSAAMSPNPQEAARGAAMTAANWEPDGATAPSVLQDQLLRALDLYTHQPARCTPRTAAASAQPQDGIPWRAAASPGLPTHSTWE